MNASWSIACSEGRRWSALRSGSDLRQMVVERGHVFAADVFPAAEPVGGYGAARGHPGGIDLERSPSHVQEERHAGLGKPCPEWIQIVVSG